MVTRKYDEVGRLAALNNPIQGARKQKPYPGFESHLI
jgi:hypothetical protein